VKREGELMRGLRWHGPQNSNQQKTGKKPDNKTTLNGGGEENDALRFTPQK
jgi:hypothetical protein